MSCLPHVDNCGQLGVALNEDEPLFPYPTHISEDNFSMRRVFSDKERISSHLQVEFQLSSPIEFIVQTSQPNKHFNDMVLRGHKNLNYHKFPKSPNRYEFNIKHFIYVYSRVKFMHSEGLLTVNYNQFNNTFINALMRKSVQNDNILTFIENRKSRMSIIESLESDPRFGQTMKMMTENKMFDDLYSNQTIAFYMSVVRNGKSILADKRGKSLTALTIMTYFRQDWPLVIVCDKHRKKYWDNELAMTHKCCHLFKISVIHTVNDIYVYPNPFHDIMIIDYDLYYEIKDTISFKNLNIKAFIFEDQSRGSITSHSRQWKGLSKCTENFKNVNRIIFISSKAYDSDNCKRLWPILQILDPKTFEDFQEFDARYCDPDYFLRDQMVKELQILLRSTYLICDNPFYE